MVSLESYRASMTRIQMAIYTSSSGSYQDGNKICFRIIILTYRYSISWNSFATIMKGSTKTYYPHFHRFSSTSRTCRAGTRCD